MRGRPPPPIVPKEMTDAAGAARALLHPFFGDLSTLYNTGLIAQYVALHAAVQNNHDKLNTLRAGATTSPDETWMVDYLCADRYTVLRLSVASICAEYLRRYPEQ